MRMIQEECKSRPLMGKYKIFILDECHSLTPQAWSSMLKILEEPPEFVIFLFCTTDPQKIMGTILSRVQRFNFQRISVSGIVNRLKYILEQENITTYEDSAIDYIARLAKGGMRDSITTLEKCLDYDNNLTLENVLKVTSGGVTEQALLIMMKHMLDKNARDAILHFNEIYMQGIDISLFLKLYIEFLQNCVKYMITQSSKITTISEKTIHWLDINCLDDNKELNDLFAEIRGLMFGAMDVNTNCGTDDLRIIIESWIIRECK